MQNVISHKYESRSLASLEEDLRCKENDNPRFKVLVDKFSFTVNGNEAFLRLKSFDPMLDCPVEVLHTIPLGCIKYLVDFFY